MQINTVQKKFAQSNPPLKVKVSSLSPTPKPSAIRKCFKDWPETDLIPHPKSRKPVKVMCADGLLEVKLFQYFIDIAEWKLSSKYDTADFVYYSRENNIKWDTETGVLLNKVPGLAFLCRKKEQAYIINKFKEVYFKEEHPYFPETFRMAEEHLLYTETHGVASINETHAARTYISKVESATKEGGKTVLRSPKDFKFDNATVSNKQTDHVIQRQPASPLLVGGLRHELRLYLLAASVDPLLVFLNEEGLVTAGLQPRPQTGGTAHERLAEAAGGEGACGECSSRMLLSSYWLQIELQGVDVRVVAMSSAGQK